MIKFIDNYFKHQDERGEITGLINKGSWEEINLISSLEDEVRGKHYHEFTNELFIILEGRILITLQRVVCGKIEGDIQEFMVKSGDVFIISKMVYHSFKVLEKSTWINVLDKKMDDFQKDLKRL